MPRRSNRAENALNALLGLTDVAKDVKTKATGVVVGVTEDEIQEFRERQGLVYFLQAPALFESKICKHCGEPFLVSRKYVAYCSYTCIRKSLNEQGFEWRKGRDLEALVVDPEVYDGNEPIWITKPSLEKALGILQKMLLDGSDSATQSSTVSPPKSPSDDITTDKTPVTDPSSSSLEDSATTQSGTVELGKTTSTRRSGRRVVSFQ